MHNSIVHFSGIESVSWFDFSVRIFELLSQVGKIKSTPTLSRIMSSEFAAAALRPSNSRLACDLALFKKLNFTPKPLDECILEVLKEIKIRKQFVIDEL
jgi:dTDP-4-dehydrorhamnose reductase